MTLPAADSLKDTWVSIFRRKGGDGVRTRLFENFDSTQQRLLCVELNLRKSELPVIASIPDSRNWFVLTTERLAWSIEGKRQDLPVGKIRDATADLRQLQRDRRSKLDMSQLQIVTMEGNKYTIELEAGHSLNGTWNVLKNIGARNLRRG